MRPSWAGSACARDQRRTLTQAAGAPSQSPAAAHARAAHVSLQAGELTTDSSRPLLRSGRARRGRSLTYWARSPRATAGPLIDGDRMRMLKAPRVPRRQFPGFRYQLPSTHKDAIRLSGNAGAAAGGATSSKPSGRPAAERSSRARGGHATAPKKLSDQARGLAKCATPGPRQPFTPGPGAGGASLST